MEHNDYKALLVAANLARYKGGEFMIILVMILPVLTVSTLP